jgi:hypothetical protein
VTASQSEPLVTEWPASEKSHLELLIAKGGVAVAYSGCEMHVLEGCAVKGNYAFQKTTIATDTVDIENEDDLYAKLPLGAVSLAGDLARSGRLSIDTTVVGQYSLAGMTPADVGSDGECGTATHLVTALSIGAFKMRAGGQAKVGGSVGAGGVGIGGSHGESEETLREAGDPAKCNDTGTAPNDQCKSPVQIFLQPIPNRASLAGPTRQAMEEKPPTPDSVKVNFKPESDDQRWSLMTSDNKLVCDLPCSRWVPPKSGYRLQLDADKKEDIVSVNVPDDLGYSAGRTVDGTVGKAHGVGLGLGFTLGGGTLVVLGGAMLAIAEGVPNATISPALALAPGIPGLLMLVPGIIVLAGSRNMSGLDLTLASPSSAGVKLGPGFIEARGSSPTAPSLLITPAGVAGSF